MRAAPTPGTIPESQMVRAALVAWTAVVGGIALHALAYPHLHTVFPTYAEAARSGWACRDLYPGPLTNEYRYSPLFAILVSPFAVLPEALGNALWKVFGCGALAYGLRAFFRSVGPGSPDPRQTATLFLLALPTALISMYNGQANLVMLAAILLGLEAVARERWNAAAFWLAAAVLVKGYPLALALLLAALFPRRLAWRLPAAVGLGLLLPLALPPPAFALRQLALWTTQLRDTSSVRKAGYRSFDSLWNLYAPPLPARVCLALGIVTGALVFLLCLRDARRHVSRRQLLLRTLQLFSVWVVLFGPAAEAATYVIVGPGLAWALFEAFTAPSGPLPRGLLVTSFLLMGPLATDLLGPAVRQFVVGHGGLPLGALLYLGVLVWRPPAPSPGCPPLQGSMPPSQELPAPAAHPKQ